MDYIDTNVVLSLINPADINHDTALRLTRESKEMAISMVTVLEMRSVMAKTTNLREEEIEAYVQYLDRLGFELKSIDMGKVFQRAAEISFSVRMKTLDLLHLAACSETGAGRLITLDQEFGIRREEIKRMGIDVRLQ